MNVNQVNNRHKLINCHYNQLLIYY